MRPALVRLGDPEGLAQDLAQDAATRVWEFLLRGNEVRSPVGLIKKALWNGFRDKWHVSVGRREAALPDGFDPDDGVNHDPSPDLDLTAALLLLRSSYRAVAELRLLKGMTHPEIAAVLNISEANSRKLWERACAELKDLLHGYRERR
jgi:DNA-directed RNA polymerase specialized sigma24 family protein